MPWSPKFPGSREEPPDMYEASNPFDCVVCGERGDLDDDEHIEAIYHGKDGYACADCKWTALNAMFGDYLKEKNVPALLQSLPNEGLSVAPDVNVVLALQERNVTGWFVSPSFMLMELMSMPGGK